MKKINYLFVALISIALIACKDKKVPDPVVQSNPPVANSGDHSYTFTVNGNEFNNEIVSGTIPKEEAFALYTPTPVSTNKGISFNGSVADKSLTVNFIRKDNALLDLGENNGSGNYEHSVIQLMFTVNGQVYTLESLSGTCTEKSFSIDGSGSMAAINATFSGTFRGGPTGTNDPQEYQVAGEVDVKFIE